MADAQAGQPMDPHLSGSTSDPPSNSTPRSIYDPPERYKAVCDYARSANVYGKIPADDVGVIVAVVADKVLRRVDANPGMVSEFHELRSYITTAAFNEVKDYRKAAAKKIKCETEFGNEVNNRVHEATMPDLVAERRMRREDLERAIGTLEPRERRYFELRHGRQLKYKEIAELEGVSVKTVEAALSRAHAKLAILLAEYNPNLPPSTNELCEAHP
jgi:RNA polymerase sigma factor (sigma-70 family)